MTRLWIRLGFRNVMRQRRRSLFNVLTLGVNTAMLILLVGTLRGFYRTSLDRTIDLRTGHIQIHHRKYADEKRRLPLDFVISHSDSVCEEIEKIEGVISASPRIVTAASLSNGRDRAAVVLYAVEPEAERDVGVILNGVTRGATLSDSVEGILIGEKLAQLLSANPGESLLLYAQTKDCSNNLIDATVRGVFSTGFPMADRSAVYISMPLAESLLDMHDEVTEIVIRSKNYTVVPSQTERIRRAFAESGQDSLVVEPWYVIARDIVVNIQMDLISYGIIGLILVSLAVFGIMNTMTVSVFERTAEIGALRALGVEKKQIRKMFLAEGLSLGVGGILIGSLLGGVLAWYMNTYGISLPKEALEGISIPLGETYRADSHVVDWFIGALLAMSSALAGAVFPARRASQVPVTSALARGVR